MASAFNKSTGEMLVLDSSGKWVKPKTATHPQTGDTLFLDGEEWKPVPMTSREDAHGAFAATLQGPLMGGADEALAAVENPLYSLSSIGAAITGTPQSEVDAAHPEGARDYKSSVEHFRSTEDRYRREHPGRSFALTAGAGLLGGGYHLGRAAFGATERLLPAAGAVTRAAVTGAGFGGVAGFASGEGSAADRAVSAVFGAGFGAGVGAGIEAASPVVAQFVRAIRGNPALADGAGNLTPAGQRAAEQAGLDPRQMSQELNREFSTQARDALHPGQAASVAEARSLPVPVTPTRGQTTLIPDDQMFESQAAKDVYGRPAGDQMRAAFEGQQEALRANVPAIASRIAGGQPRVAELGQGAQQAQTALSAAERSAKANVNRLYETARSGEDAAIDPGSYLQGVHRVFQTVLSNFQSEAIPNVARVLRAFGARAQQGGDIGVSEVFAARQRLAALQSSQGPEGVAARQAKQEIDRWTTSLLDGAALSGDSAAIARWRAAIASRRDYGERFQGGDLVEKLTERAYQGGQSVLKQDALGAVNLIFGRAKTGWVSRGGMIRDLTRVRQELGENSPGWAALREEAFLRFARNIEGASNPTGREFSGANFAKSWNDALRESPEVMRILFNDQERALISQFVRVALRTTTNIKGGANPSNTSAGVVQVMRRLFASAFMGPKMAAFLSDLPVVKAISNLGYTIRSEAHARNALQTRAAPVPEFGYGAPATASASVQQRERQGR